MKLASIRPAIFGALLLPVLAFAQDRPAATTALYDGWRNMGSIYVLTTPEGASLPTGSVEKDFPLLVRLHKDFFDFSQAKADGADVRFSTSAGEPLAHQVEEWDTARGAASIWVRLPVIKGDERQELRVHWGKSDAVSESRGAAVFNEANGYLSVWHMNSPVRDEVGTLDSKDEGTTTTPGIIGPARHFAGGQGVFAGDQINRYPTGSSPHTSEAWLRVEQPNGRVVAWGNEQAQGKVVMQVRGPPHIGVDAYFSNANAQGGGALAMSEWVQVVHTYEKGNSRVYVNGVLDGVAKSSATPLNIKRPARLWLGGWYQDYDFVGDLDEVRVSKVARSADWVRLQYENQRRVQMLVGSIVQPGTSFTVSPATVMVLEGNRVAFSAQAGGAQKVL